MRQILLLILLAIPSLAAAQKFNLSGTLSDTLNSPLPSATIMLLNAKDSTLATFGVSDQKGFFQMKGVAPGRYVFKVTFVGYATHTQLLAPEPGVVDLDLGRIKLKPQATQLDELVVKAEKAPVTVKRDTIEFNAGSFKTKANANVEDLLKKMPGIDVESDGTLRAQGEQVQRVTVDGREFFGRDPKLATRNLPADAVEKVQVFDRKSDQSQFTGIDDGQKEKTINLELKPEKRNGAFGTLMAGAGTDGRYQGRGNINRFTKGKQLSFLGMGNNVNEQGFSFGDYMNFSGGSTQMMGGGGGAMAIQINGDNQNGVPMNFGGRPNGITTNYAGGLNFNNNVSKKTDINGSYFYNNVDQNIDRAVERVNFIPDGIYRFNSLSLQRNNNENHRLNFTIDHRIDSANSLRFNANASMTNSRLSTLTESETMTPEGDLQNSSATNNLTNGNGFNFNSSLLYRHRFEKKGRSMSVNVNAVAAQNESHGDLTAENSFFNTGEKRNVSQENEQRTDNQTIGTTFSFIEPLGGRKYLEASYNFRTNRNQVERSVYDVAGSNRTMNTLLSNAYNSDYFYNRPGLMMRINRQKFNMSFGANWQRTTIAGRLVLREIDINRTFQNILPVMRLNYDFSSMKRMRFDYEASMQEPTIQQLQPVIDNTTNQINQSVGNPELQPGYTHRVMASYNAFDPASGVGLFGYLNGSYTTNSISYSQTINPNLSTLTMPVNVRNASLINGNFNFGFPVRKLMSRINVGPTVSRLGNRVFLNETEVTSMQQTIGGSARYSFNYKDIFTLDLSANLRNQSTSYDTEGASKPQDQKYFNKTYSTETNVTILKNYQLNASFDYMMYDSRTTGFSQEIPLLNVSVSRFFFKAQSGELKLGVVNLLDKSLSVTQQSNVNYLEQTTYNNLGRYYMISFTYALNKQLNPMGTRGGRGGPRMVIQQTN